MTVYPTPDVRNLVVGKANIYFTPAGASYPTGRIHMGNVTAFTMEPTIETLEHFSSMAGVRTRDRVVTLQRSATMALTCEEWSPQNLAIAFLGEVEEGSDGETIVTGLTQDLVRGRIDAEMTNDVGPRWNFTFPSVAMRPAGPVGIISDEWAEIEMEGDIEAVDGRFWTATLASTDAPTDAPTEPAT